MDADIEFGELEQAAPKQRLRPDQNKQFAVVPYGSPREDDLPIFLDLDVMRDMELHAQSNTSVELGGVLLGGQFEDEQGRPFVVVTDSLRAEHYESTKGSFKFTHDTWSEITRQREEFPADLQMVGWYHTHPDWGVFLSGMDMFICDNFFSKPLDVAYVIDPCRLDRAMFMWTGDPAQRIRRTGAFYVMASRFRRAELEQHAAQLEINMPQDPRFGGFQGPYPAPIVNISEQRTPWLPIAVMGMLTMQFLLLVVIVVALFLPARFRDGQSLREERKFLDEVVKKVAEGGARDVVTSLEEKRQELEEFKSAAKGLGSELRTLEKAVKEAKDTETTLTERLNKTEKERDKLKTENERLEKEKKKKAQDKDSETKEGEESDEERKSLDWKWIGLGAAGLAVLLAAGATMFVVWRKDQQEFDSDNEEPHEREPG